MRSLREMELLLIGIMSVTLRLFLTWIKQLKMTD